MPLYDVWVCLYMMCGVWGLGWCYQLPLTAGWGVGVPQAFMMVSAAYLSLYIGVIMWFQFTKDRLQCCSPCNFAR